MASHGLSKQTLRRGQKRRGWTSCAISSLGKEWKALQLLFQKVFRCASEVASYYLLSYLSSCFEFFPFDKVLFCSVLWLIALDRGNRVHRVPFSLIEFSQIQKERHSKQCLLVILSRRMSWFLLNSSWQEPYITLYTAIFIALKNFWNKRMHLYCFRLWWEPLSLPHVPPSELWGLYWSNKWNRPSSSLITSLFGAGMWHGGFCWCKGICIKGISVSSHLLLKLGFVQSLWARLDFLNSTSFRSY